MNLIHTQIKIDGTQSELKFEQIQQFRSWQLNALTLEGEPVLFLESVFKSCRPSVQALRFIKCLPVTFVYVKSSDVKLIKPKI